MYFVCEKYSKKNGVASEKKLTPLSKRPHSFASCLYNISCVIPFKSKQRIQHTYNMAPRLTAAQTQLIADNPIENALDSFHLAFDAKRRSAGIASNPHLALNRLDDKGTYVLLFSH